MVQTTGVGGGVGGGGDSNISSSSFLKSINIDDVGGAGVSQSSRPSKMLNGGVPKEDGEFRTLRYRLDQLDYKEWLDPISTPLVKRLLSDLVNTTQVAREWKSLGSGLQEEIRVLQEQVNPLRKELSGLEQENGMLHREIIEMQDARDTMTRMHQAQQRKMEKEMQELRFMNSQLQSEVGRERDKARASFKKVEELGEKVGLIVTPDDGFTIKQQDKAAKAKLFERVQKIDIETGLAPLDTYRPFPPSNPSYFDLVVLAEERASKHESAARTERAKSSALQEEIQTVLDQVSKRDREITRLSSQLELVRNNQFTTGRTVTPGLHIGAIQGINDLDAAKDRIQHLELQLESLHTHIETLESDITSMQGQKINVLTSITDEKKKVELELEKERKKVAVLVGNVERMEGIVAELEGYRNKMSGGFGGSVIKPSVAVKLVQELTLKLNASALKSDQSSKRLAMLHKDVTRLQNENSKLKKNVDDLEAHILKNTPSGPTQQPPTTSTKGDEKAREIEAKLNDTIQIKDQLNSKLSSLQLTLSNQTSHLQTLSLKLEQTDRALQDSKIERNGLSRECKLLEQERDSLKNALQVIEGSVDEVCQRVDSVCKERDVAKELYSQVHDELERVRRSGTSTAPQNAGDSQVSNATASDTLKSKITSLENENEALKKKAGEWEKQVQILKEDMKALVLRQRENGSLAGEAVTLLEKELQELQHRLNEGEDAKKDLDRQILALQSTIQDLTKTNSNLTKQSDLDTKKLLQLELDLEKSKLELRQASAAKAEVEGRLRGLESSISGIERKAADRERIIGDQKHLLDEIDKERDNFQRELDSKAEKLLDLQDQLVEIQQRFSSSEKKCTSLQEQVDALTKHLNTSDRETSSLSKQLTDAVMASKHWEDQAQQYHNEGQRLASDLVALTRENQILSGELGEASSVRDRYRAELIECENQLGTLNEFIRTKEEEKQEIMANYRRIIADHERLEVAYRSNIEEANNLRMELVARDKKIGSMERQIDQVSREANQFQMDNNAHSKQHSNLSRALATSERQIKQLEADKLRLTREIQAARELAHSMDRNKDSVQSQFIQLSLEHDRLVKKLEKTSVEMNALQTQLKAEILKAERLEQLLNSERTRKIQTERSELDIKQSQAQMESRMRQLNEQQEISLSTTRGQLDDARRALTATGDRIAHLEVLVVQKDSEIKELTTLLNSSRMEVVTLKETTKKLQENVNDIVIRHNQNVPAETRLMSELQQTQREQAILSTQLEHTMSPADSVASLASKSTVGNSDAHAHAQQLQVMDTIIDYEVEHDDAHGKSRESSV